ncbi:hypothetical protein D3C71_1401740 [compost metagenome]
MTNMPLDRITIVNASQIDNNSRFRKNRHSSMIIAIKIRDPLSTKSKISRFT